METLGNPGKHPGRVAGCTVTSFVTPAGLQWAYRSSIKTRNEGVERATAGGGPIRVTHSRHLFDFHINGDEGP
jgi:hypothetical protein